MIVNCTKLHEDIRKSGKTLKQLVEASGVSFYTLSRITPTIPYMDKTERVIGAICEVLGSSPDDYEMTTDKMINRINDLNLGITMTESAAVKKKLTSEKDLLEKLL